MVLRKNPDLKARPLTLAGFGIPTLHFFAGNAGKASKVPAWDLKSQRSSGCRLYVPTALTLYDPCQLKG